MINASAIPETPVKPMLVAANQGDRDVSIIDPVAAKQLATVPEGGITGHEVATSPDGRTAYVPIYGSSGVGKPGTDGHEMVVIDIPSRTVTGKVDFGHGVRPHCPVYDRASGMLYVTTELDQTVTIIDPKTLKIVGTVPTGQKESHMLVISRDGQARLHLERGRQVPSRYWIWPAARRSPSFPSHPNPNASPYRTTTRWSLLPTRPSRNWQ